MGDKKTRIIAGILSGLVLLLCGISISGADNEKSGKIKGQVDYCSKGGYAGMRIYIPGRQFMIISGSKGDFLFEGIPPGTYEINYSIDEKLVNANHDVMVVSGQTTDLGTIAFCKDNAAKQGASSEGGTAMNCDEGSAECEDKDKDGVMAAKDCDDNNPKIYPGAAEICDGIDNNCDGQLDNVKTSPVVNGIGICKQGKILVDSCNRGFADCDGNSDNGCETDIFNDSQNCGGCNNQCSPTDFCRLGIC